VHHTESEKIFPGYPDASITVLAVLLHGVLPSRPPASVQRCNREGKLYLTSVVGTNSDPSDEIHLWIIIYFSFCLPRLPQVPLVARPVK
jgi:hypothetical protein